MIRLHRLNGQEVVVNADLIESIESHGSETMLAMATGNHLIVRESATEVVTRALDYKKTVFVGATYLPQFLRGKEDTPCR